MPFRLGRANPAPEIVERETEELQRPVVRLLTRPMGARRVQRTVARPAAQGGSSRLRVKGNATCRPYMSRPGTSGVRGRPRPSAVRGRHWSILPPHSSTECALSAGRGRALCKRSSVCGNRSAAARLSDKEADPCRAEPSPTKAPDRRSAQSGVLAETPVSQPACPADGTLDCRPAPKCLGRAAPVEVRGRPWIRRRRATRRRLEAPRRGRRFPPPR